MGPELLRRFQWEVLAQTNFVLIEHRAMREAEADWDRHEQRVADHFEEMKKASLATYERGSPLDYAPGEHRELVERVFEIADNAPKHTGAPTAVWCAIQGVLVSAANISKLLWGAPSDRKKQRQVERWREPLRASLAVASDSPLRSRAVRNGFEHFDENLEKFNPKGYMPRTIGPTGDPPALHFGRYEPDTGLVTFWKSQPISIPDVMAEVERIRPLCVAELGWLAEER